MPLFFSKHRNIHSQSCACSLGIIGKHSLPGIPRTSIMASTILTSPATLSVQSRQSTSPQPPTSSQRSIESVSPTKAAQGPVSHPRVRHKGPSFRKPQKVVTINVGPSDSVESFAIHLHLLTHYSTYFSTAFSPPNLEAETNTMSLPSTCPSTFGLLTHWLYTQQLDLFPSEASSNTLLLASLWCLASTFKIPRLQNKVMAWLQPITEGLQGEGLKEFLCFVYKQENCEGMEKLRKLAVDRMAWGTSAKALGSWIQGGYLPGEMVVDVLVALRGDKGGAEGQGMKLGAREYFVGVEGEMVGAKVEVLE